MGPALDDETHPARIPESDLKDRRLVERCLDGEGAAWRELVSAYAPALSARVRHVFFRRVGRKPTPAETEEMVQDAFVRAARDGGRSLRRFRWESSLKSYLSAIAAACALDRIRTDAAGRMRWGPRSDLLAVDRVASSNAPLPEGTLLAQERARKVEEALADLPARTRLAVEMRYWGGLSAGQIGRSMGVSDRYVRELLGEAAEKLKRILRDA